MEPDWQQLWRAIREVDAGVANAWSALLVGLEPVLVVMARREPIGQPRDRDEAPREVVLGVLRRLHANDHAAIRKLCAMERPPELRAWLRVLVRRSAIERKLGTNDRAREQPSADDDGISLVRLARETFGPERAEIVALVRDLVKRARAEQLAAGDDAFERLALRWKLDRIHVRRLVENGERYLAVLGSALAGYSEQEIATQLEITPRDVELTVRYLEQLLDARTRARTSAAG